MSGVPLADGRAAAIAHRGASADRPENTLTSFDEALRQGADGIELDLQLTRDGVVVVFHDWTLDKLGDGRRGIPAISLEELRRLDAGAWFAAPYAGERVPTLGEVLARVRPPIRLLLELKPEPDAAAAERLLRATVREVREAEAGERASLLCFDAPLLERAGAVAPELDRVLNVDAQGVRAALSSGRPRGLAALSFDVRALGPETVAALRRDGSPLYVYTCNREDDVERALSAGARAIMSDRPGWLARTLRALAG